MLKAGCAALSRPTGLAPMYVPKQELGDEMKSDVGRVSRAILGA
jgi:hypothetical protein